MDKYKMQKWTGSKDYWEKRYAGGGNSGSGSYGELATFKATILNDFIKDRGIYSVIEWGCGDGNQVSLGTYHKYIGLDVSASVIEQCKRRFEGDSTKEFFCTYSKIPEIEKADMAISLDVIYHLVEDEVFEDYMDNLFDSAKKYVCIYSWNYEGDHVLEYCKPRKFTDYVEKKYENWKLLMKINQKYARDETNPDFEKTSKSDFYFYEKIERAEK